MDAFEELVAEILRADGYWVQRGYKIELTTAEKRALDNHSMPRPELDLVAYKPARNELLALECKSYLDSTGVHVRDLMPDGRLQNRYKMFTKEPLRTVVLAKLVDQLAEASMIVGTPTPQLGLVYGRAVPSAEPQLKALFEANEWLLFDPIGSGRACKQPREVDTRTAPPLWCPSFCSTARILAKGEAASHNISWRHTMCATRPAFAELSVSHPIRARRQALSLLLSDTE